MKNNTGLVSISFRQLNPEQIMSAVKNAGLANIEWGADVHCKPEDKAAAELINKLSKEKGINSCAYGSYYRVGAENAGNADFADIVSAASALNTDIIRVWAFNKGSDKTTPEEYSSVVSDMKRICGMATEKNIKISLECHNNTLTDCYDSALRLIEDVSCDNLTMYWQPNQFKSLEYNLESAKALRDYVTNVHVFNWDKNDKLPLAGGIDVWKKYVDIIEGSAKYQHNYLLEFMPFGEVSELEAEAEALRRILE